MRTFLSFCLPCRFLINLAAPAGNQQEPTGSIGNQQHLQGTNRKPAALPAVFELPAVGANYLLAILIGNGY